MDQSTIRAVLIELSEHDIRLQSSLTAFSENLKEINTNLARVADSSIKLAERVKVLESDLSERTYKKHLLSSLAYLYPMIIIGLLVMTNLNHDKVQSLVSNLKSLTEITRE
jgi:hypothetical protein